MKLIFRIFHGPKNLDLILSKRKISCKEIWRQHIYLVLKLDRIFSPKKVLGQDKLLGQENIFYQKRKENTFQNTQDLRRACQQKK